MKKLILLSCLVAGILGYHQQAAAQVGISVNINIGSQPVWGPTGYDYARYYYFPDIDAYYSIPNHQYIYFDGGRQVIATALPARFNFDLYSGYKVVINEPRPYLHPEVCRAKYAQYRGWKGKQAIIRDSREERYYVIKDHPMHGQWHGDDHRENRGGHGDDDHGHDNRGHGNDDHGNGGGHGHGNGHGHH